MSVAAPPEVPATQGIKYAGSKLKILPEILRLVSQTQARTVLDAFSGTTRVAQALAAEGLSVVANDISEVSEVFATCYLKAPRDAARYGELFRHLNGREEKDGWFTENYGGDPSTELSTGADGLKKPFQFQVTRKLDAIRSEIDELGLTFEEKCVALTGLVLALDKVDSTLGHFVSYLREWSPRSYNDLVLEVPVMPELTTEHEVMREDAFRAVAGTACDLAYLDPPYGSNNAKMPPSRVRYGAYYHFWKTVVLNDRPELFGKALRRRDSTDEASYSVFEDFRADDSGAYLAVNAIRDLLAATDCSFVLLSYSSGGRAARSDLLSALEGSGEIIEAVEIDHRSNVMSSMRWTDEWTRDGEAPLREYLFLLKK